LAISSVRRVPDPPGIGERILVNGLPATRVIGHGHGHYVHFMRDDGDVVLLSHPADVAPAPQQAKAALKRNCAICTASSRNRKNSWASFAVGALARLAMRPRFDLCRLG
jgi:hypothetical protein